MWRVLAGAAVACGLVANAAPTLAEDLHAATSPAYGFLLPTDGLNLDVGAGLVSRPHQLGETRQVVDAAPMFELQWGKDVHLSLVDGATWTPLHLGPFEAGPVVEFRQTYATPRLSRGLRNADQWEGGGLLRAITPLGVLEGRLRQSLDGDKTTSADVSFDTAVPLSKQVSLALEARGAWSDEAFVINVRRGRAASVALDQSTAFYAAGLQAAVIWQLSDGWLLTGLVSKDQIVSAEKHRLSFQTRGAPIASVILTRRFRIF